MSDFFYRRYQGKTDQQLEEIIRESDRYQPSAVDSARKILSERTGRKPQVNPIPPRPTKGFFDQIFDTRLLQRTFGWKDVLNWFTLAMFCMAVLHLLGYYADEPSIEPVYGWILAIIVFGMMLSIHVMFRATHKASNNVIGRLIHDLSFLFLFYSLWHLYAYVVYDQRGFFIDAELETLFVLLFLLVAWEVAIAILKRFFLTLFRWRPL